ncbi:MAG: prepilin peptidase [Chloroflexi bacterium]|nr:prepilin peptidase [Chloroflexota bacterium]
MELAQGCALSAASLAALTDVSSRRIPNWLTLGTFLLGVLLNTWLRGVDGAASSLIGTILGIGLLLPFYALGGIGAGDVKLVGALGAVLGPQALVSVAVYGALAGGAMSLFILYRNGRIKVALADLLALRRTSGSSGATAPYGVAIAAGVALSLVLPALVG